MEKYQTLKPKKQLIKFDKYKLILDPHTAVGLSVGDKQLDKKKKNIPAPPLQ